MYSSFIYVLQWIIKWMSTITDLNVRNCVVINILWLSGGIFFKGVFRVICHVHLLFSTLWEVFQRIRRRVSIYLLPLIYVIYLLILLKVSTDYHKSFNWSLILAISESFFSFELFSKFFECALTIGSEDLRHMWWMVSWNRTDSFLNSNFTMFLYHFYLLKRYVFPLSWNSLWNCSE